MKWRRPIGPQTGWAGSSRAVTAIARSDGGAWIFYRSTNDSWSGRVHLDAAGDLVTDAGSPQPNNASDSVCTDGESGYYFAGAGPSGLVVGRDDASGHQLGLFTDPVLGVEVQEVAEDPTGGVRLLATVAPTSSFGGMPPSTEHGICLASFDEALALEWALRIDVPDPGTRARALDLDVDADGRSFLTAYTIDSTPIDARYRSYIASIDPSGSISWSNFGAASTSTSTNQCVLGLADGRCAVYFFVQPTDGGSASERIDRFDANGNLTSSAPLNLGVTGFGPNFGGMLVRLASGSLGVVGNDAVPDPSSPGSSTRVPVIFRTHSSGATRLLLVPPATRDQGLGLLSIDRRSGEIVAAGGSSGSTVTSRWAVRYAFDSVGTPAACFGLPNSTGAAGVLTGLGSELVADHDFLLVASSLPPNQAALFITSRLTVPPVLLMDGELCLGGPIGRFNGPGQFQNSNEFGFANLIVDLDALPLGPGSVAASAGETFNFQAWYRDSNPGQTSNLTGALAVTFR